MPDKKSDAPDSSPEEQALEAHVDDIMKVSRDESKEPSQPTSTDSEISRIAVTVNKKLTTDPAAQVDIKTAPELPGQAKAVVADEPEAEAEVEATEPITDPVADDLVDDSETDKAVDEIVAKEGDTLLAMEDAKLARKNKPTPAGRSWKDKLRSLAKNKKTWLIVGVLLLVLLAVPLTRYKILGLVIKRPVSLTILDSKTSTPVSNAELELGGVSATTDGEGKVKLDAPIGPRSLIIKKQYYKDYDKSYFVSFNATAATVKVEATGRLVPITVVDKISAQPVAGVTVKILKSTAKTNSKGQAAVALPANAKTSQAKLSRDGYNSSDVPVQVTDKKVKANNLAITPAGQIYFLSNLSGTLDVVKTNLDGSGRKTILEGTGNEDKRQTSLLASRDWRYLVLKAKRDTPQPALYLIDTKTDKVSQFDSGDAEFSLVGWYDHSFIYSLNRSSKAVWQADRQSLKAYDADHQQLNLLDQNQAEGNADSYAYQELANFYIVKGAIVYSVQWFSYNAGEGNYDTTGKNDVIRAVQANGQNKKDYHSSPTASTGSMTAKLYTPQEIYFAIFDNTTRKTNYVEFANLTVKPADISQTGFDDTYPTFLVSPSGNQTFWSELRDGKNALFTGSNNAANKKQLASLSEYTPYGWYSDNYVLLAKNSSELYAASPISLKAGRPPLKITDYYKPDVTYSGYGYGYGGL